MESTSETPVIIVDDDEEDKVEVVAGGASGNKRRASIRADVRKLNPKRRVDSYAIAGSSSLPKVSHLRDLPGVNKCGRENGCGSLTVKERELFTSFFEKHPRRIKIDLGKDNSRFKLYAWSKNVGENYDAVGYILTVNKTFKCEDEFISYLLHGEESGSLLNLGVPRMDIRYDREHKVFYLHIRTIPEERTSLKTFLHRSLGNEIRFYLWDARSSCQFS